MVRARLMLGIVSHLRNEPIDGVSHSRHGAEVAVYDALSLSPATVQSLAEAESTHPVKHTEVHLLRLAPHLVGDELGHDAEHVGSGAAVDVLSTGEGLAQMLVPREVRHHAQLHL